MVIGAGGFLGRSLCRAMLTAGIEAIAASSANGTGIDPLTGLLPDDFRVPQGTDGVVYLAQSPYAARMPAMASHVFAVNTLTALQAALRARAAGATRFVYASTGNVYQPSFAPLQESHPLRRDDWYALSKVHAEESVALLSADMEITSLRIFGLYGPGQSGRLVPNLIRAVAAERAVLLERPGADAEADGGLRISLLHVEDASHAICRLLAMRGVPVLNLASDEVWDIQSICLSIGKALGIRPQFRNAAAARKGNMIADTARMLRLLQPRFTPFNAAIEAMVRSAAAQHVHH